MDNIYAAAAGFIYISNRGKALSKADYSGGLPKLGVSELAKRLGVDCLNLNTVIILFALHTAVALPFSVLLAAHGSVSEVHSNSPNPNLM